MVSTSDISSNKPTTSELISVAAGETVLAETENANNTLMLNAIILAFNWIIDSGVQLAANTFTGIQTFSAGIKTDSIKSTTGSADVLLSNGTFKYGGSAAGDELTNKTYVAAQIAAASTTGVSDGDKGEITVSSSGIVWTIDNNVITNAKMADNAIDTAEIVNSAVTTAKIADSNVTTAKIADSNVTTAKIADSNVTAAKLATGAVTQSKLAFTFSTKTTTYTAIANDYLFCDTSSAAWTLTFPASATAGDMIHIVDLNNTFDTKNLTIAPNGLKIEAQTGNLVLDLKGFVGTFYYIDATTGWKRI